MKVNRKIQRLLSNNPDNKNKNVCVLAIAKALGCENDTRYLHNINDLVYALRTRHTVRSRADRAKGKTVGKVRPMLHAIAAEVNAKAFVARVSGKVGGCGHVLMFDTGGNTVVDTAPRRRDRRKVTHLYVIYDKAGEDAASTSD